ncbi:MAG TPA: hypothetical protein DEF00_02175 [Candidatus Taylorbacteria bacterium]|nr:MAG: hypothetical protein UY03_C0006G0016 [Parcubacteria group bacterium GW2011_GWA2_47_64]KKU96524.1 MAG: hypothetical protein UY29_C0010G0029 [Parcubacteria group bacterium GW2011_GWC2_48_17]HBV01183.1 hypothetical protein [Candidatus Taylorbacteria bacterium]
MSWKTFVCIAVVYQYGLVQVAIKKIGAVPGSRTRKLVWQYLFAAFLALTAGAIAGRLELTPSVLIVAVIGAGNAFACYCHWRAYDISMARTAMLSTLDDFTAIGLGYLLLGELQVLTPLLTAGVVISAVSAIMFSRVKNPSEATSRSLIFWVLGYSSIWGVAMFSLRYFSLQGLSMITFGAAWYSGAFIGALITRFVIMGRDEAGPPLSNGERAKVFLLAVLIWTSLMFCYRLRELVPVTVIQPIQLVSEMSIPAIIGMMFFGEAKKMSRKEIAVIAVGLLGAVLIAVAY